MSLSYFQTISLMANHFDPISLDEMDSVQLMDRIDMKFILPIDQLLVLLPELYTNYRILTICNNQVFNYRTDYFDTPELAMFYDHHNGKLTRFKVRRREYVDSRIEFLEIKFRSNKGRIIKQRVEDNNSDNQLFDGFISQHTPYNPCKLHRTVINHFNRFTLVDTEMQERVTTDFNVSFTDNTRTISLNGLVIIEIKQAHADKMSLVYRLMKKNSIRPSSISKYCVGVSLLNDKPKKNNFKETILQINKISHVEFTT
jgi:hypothetical protein